jgi:hypothetical protein
LVADGGGVRARGWVGGCGHGIGDLEKRLCGHNGPLFALRWSPSGKPWVPLLFRKGGFLPLLNPSTRTHNTHNTHTHTHVYTLI